MSTFLSEINLRHRLTQIIVMIVMILACLLVSQFAHAQKSAKKIRYDQPKFKVQVHKSSHKACYVMYKKRTATPKGPVIASGRKGRIRKGMAETDF
ncbi:MAG: hypothetical protein SH819_06770 [Cytophagales bacterium]|nr:hypothetical protein [Cytophagales bacterium]